jgi:nucleoid DNA-binding protein
MNLNELNKERLALIERFKKRMEFLNLKVDENSVTEIERVNANLYYPLKEAEIESFKKADGNELETKAAKVNSSAALLLNVFTPLRRGEKITLQGFGEFNSYELEKQLQVLNGNGKKANIDMLLENKKSIIYIESKFTELFYYRKKATTSSSYQDMRKYPNKDIYQAAIQFIDKYQLYDANQLVKHTIGIYRDCLNNPDRYIGKKVYLLNLNWELITSDKDLRESFKLQLEALQEGTDFIGRFNKVMKNCFKRIGIDFKFIYINYYDFYTRIMRFKKTDHILYNYLKQRYFLLQRRGLNTDDAIKYIEAHLDNEIAKTQFKEMIKDYNVIYLMEYSGAFSDDIVLDDRFKKFLDAIISIKNVDKKIPRIIGEYSLNEYLHIHSSNYYKKTTIIYLSKVLPKADRVILI